MKRRKLVYDDGFMVLYCSYHDRERAKSVSGYRWSAQKKGWVYPLNAETLAAIEAAFPGIEVDHRIREALLREAKAIADVRALKAVGDANVEVPTKTTPMRHQRLAFAIATKLPAAALFMEQGMGKTKVAIDATAWRFINSGVRRVLVVAPTSVVPVWPREYARHCGVPHEVRELTGPIAKRIKTLAAWAPSDTTLQVAVTNYEGAREMVDALIDWLKRGPGAGMVIADESQRIKGHATKQSKAMAKIGQAVPYRLILSGTPITQSPLDIFGQYRFLAPHIFGTSFTQFRARYAILGGYNGKQVIGYRNIDELIRKAHSIAFRATKAEALDLPDEVDQTLFVDLEGRARRIYEDMRRESIAALSADEFVIAQNVLTRILRLQQITGGFVPREDGTAEQVSDAKLRVLDETLDDLLAVPDKKVVVFARFLPELRAIEKLVDRKGVGWRSIDGSVPMEARGRYVDEFQNDPAVRVFIAQTATAGLGITLTAADTAVFYSLDYSLANYEQARARISRIGQRNKMTYIHILARGTVDERVFEALAAKKNIAQLVIDRWRDFLGEE